MKRLIIIVAMALPLPSKAMSTVECMASATYHEARGEGEQGVIAVAHTILNRSRKSNLSVCQTLRKMGQFSFVKRGVLPHAPSEYTMLALQAINGYNRGMDKSKGATFFVFHKCKPKWLKGMKRTVRVGHHSFYKEK